MSDNGSNEHNPWQRKPPQGPPDLLQEMKKFLQKYLNAKLFHRNGDGQKAAIPIVRYVGIAFIALIAIWVLAGVFVVSPAEEAVVLRFGKYIQTLGPGPHWIPSIIESKEKINVQQVSNFSYESTM